MADLNVRANEVYSIICEAFDSRNWKYDKKEEKFIAFIEFSGDDLPMKYFLYIDPSKEAVFLRSDIGVKFPTDKLVDAAVAVSIANHNAVEGGFHLDINTGEISFESAATYMGGCAITKEYILEVFDFAYWTVEKYNDLFFALKNGYIDIAGFIEKADKK